MRMRVYLKMKLTNNQKKYLRSIAHDLKPFVMVGQNGLSDSVLAEIDSTLQKHELIKIKLRVDDRDVKQNIIERIITLGNVEESFSLKDEEEKKSVSCILGTRKFF